MKHFCSFLLSFVAVALFSAGAMAEASFSQWLSEFKAEALQAGISQATLDATFEGTETDDSIIELDRKQPEGRLSFAEYAKRNLTAKRIRDGQNFFAENEELLTRVGRKYGVQPRFIAALWGIETDFGRYTGNFVTTDALATLAFDGRRAAFFRGELLDALRILESEHMKAEEMYGSWAGAIGQCQFMPSTFLKYAVDFDGDGKRDVWDNKADIYASIAHYLQSLGWKDDEGWGRPVEVPDAFDEALIDIKSSKPLSEWKKLGVRKSDGSPL
ncbi:MAG: lytic murein transglycosylase, partial [Rickettsiales bacterium]|nr:lytic murein transglycosylase [Rickettsiales bacterium]